MCRAFVRFGVTVKPSPQDRIPGDQFENIFRACPANENFTAVFWGRCYRLPLAHFGLQAEIFELL